MTFQQILDKYRQFAFSERDKGDKFERLMQAYLQTDQMYVNELATVWLWSDFPYRSQFGGKDTGIDLVALTYAGDYWAIQCKCFQETAIIDKPAVDSFLSTSSRHFTAEGEKQVAFTHRLWISTTNHWGDNAEEAIKNQSPPVNRVHLHELQQSGVDWEKLDNGQTGEGAKKDKKSLRPHQSAALKAVNQHFLDYNRAKIIMACGTGKTFTSLKIAENEAPQTGIVLFLVPSIALLGQTLREWTAEAENPIHAICICSDANVSKKKAQNDEGDMSTIDLALPASTNVDNIIRQIEYIQKKPKKGLIVFFSTYQSIEVVAKVQNKLMEKQPEKGVFDLIVCDEAHRTTGITLSGEDASAFVKVHDNEFIKAKKRLYMTATPRLYGEDARSKAQRYEAVLCSMDDEDLYGQEVYRIGFGEAVERGLLSDYKVLILTLNENDVSEAVQNMVTDNEDMEIKTDDVSKLIGCINAFSKQFIGDDGTTRASDPEPMRSAVAFCSKIKDSQKVAGIFNSLQTAYHDTLSPEKKAVTVKVEAHHVDGAMSIAAREEKLAWLKEYDSQKPACKILTNAKCLSEGVDVPSLDAVIFLSARDSQVDVVQSVGRVMRRAPGKNYGYIIIPIIIPANVPPDQALENNDRYRVVWSVLNALRAHDDRFNATVNQIELNRKKPENIKVVGIDATGNADYQVDSKANSDAEKKVQNQVAIQFDGLQGVIYAKLVEKVGDPSFWEKWAKDVAHIAERQTERIKHLIATKTDQRTAFENFLAGLQKNINPSITEPQAIDMLAQHIITKPIFEALFEGYSFVKSNAVSTAMQGMLEVLEGKSVAEESETLQKFYESVRQKVQKIDNAEGKQRIIIELYDKFFKTAFPKMVEQLGIVYTPVEVVDFIIHSVNDILKKEFGRSISDENIHVLDPFTGTGTFMTRLLQSGLIDKKDLARKYGQELHANEIVLLAYYIAAVNIENAYHDQLGQDAAYEPFEGIVLTDTFQLGETDGNQKVIAEMFPQNSERVARQKKAPLRVIIGNPPYSVGQKSANDNAQNQKYEKLDKRIEETYAKGSAATSVKALYDAYIKAFRWSTDRLDPKHGGIIAFVSNGAWLDTNGMDGFRKVLEKEFSSIWIFNLRGNQRTSGELSRKEGGKIFGSGSRTPISITLLVKNPIASNKKAAIHYHDIGDYLSREEKLLIVRRFKTMTNDALPWKKLEPNVDGDWISHRNDIFGTFIPLDANKKFDLKSESFFNTYSLGLATGRDAWVINFSKNEVRSNVKNSLSFYNNQINRFKEIRKEKPTLQVDSFINTDPSKISWNRNLKNDIEKYRVISYKDSAIRTCLYRPFLKNYLYFDKDYNAMLYQNKKLFPNSTLNNLVICVSGVGGNKGFSVLISELIPSLDTIEKAQCFPLYYYEEKTLKNGETLNMYESGASGFERKDGISNFILEKAQQQYGAEVNKEDIFYYVYGLLHSPEYRRAFANDLKKMLPRLPLIDSGTDFWKFSRAGRALAELHLNYENYPKLDGVHEMHIIEGNINYKVTKMRFPANHKIDKRDIIYNDHIIIQNIPARAYEYVVNGKSAIEWIMERYQVTVHKESGIKNDPNDWAEELGNPRYILDLLLSIINVSVQTVEIVENLPKLEFGEVGNESEE